MGTEHARKASVLKISIKAIAELKAVGTICFTARLLDRVFSGLSDREAKEFENILHLSVLF
ncbi:hypothetical protein ccbrp13_31610 [Ktedonobacteria bacterium brp13]|nr:hypothetical protein ccbrp13_31610 [Ktedonobacteria bacterium brp13]